MNHARQIAARGRLAQSVWMASGVWAVTHFAGGLPIVSAQQTNPFAVQHDQWTDYSPPIGNMPVAQARLQVPQVGNVVQSQPARTSPIGSTPSGNIGYQASVHVGPQPSAFTPESFGYSPQPTPAAALVTPAPGAARPSRLPVASSQDGDRPEPNEALPRFANRHTKLASAARQRSNFIASTPPAPPSATSVYLASQTAQSQIDAAAKLLRQAGLEYECAAFASAETSVWEALEKAAAAIDLTHAPAGHAARNSGYGNPADAALQQLHQGKRALIEAQDFVGPFAQGDPQAIARLARAHQTAVVRETLPPMMGSYSAEARMRLGRERLQPNTARELPTAGEAIDRYLDFARSQFSGIAADSMLAAQAMDLLAAIRLGRNEPTQLPGPTAICLRRAAVQGQSGNADLVAKLGHQLADVGLNDEARWALGHSLTLQFNPANAARLASLNATAQRAADSPYGSSILAATRAPEVYGNQPKRVPEITALPPDQFAAISTSVIPGSPQSETAAGVRPVYATPVQQQFANAATQNPANAHNSATTNNSAEPSSRSFFQAMTASFQSQSPPADNSQAMPTSQQPTAMMPAYRTAPDQSTANPARNDGRVSSRFLPAMKKWW